MISHSLWVSPYLHKISQVGLDRCETIWGVTGRCKLRALDSDLDIFINPKHWTVDILDMLKFYSLIKIYLLCVSFHKFHDNCFLEENTATGQGSGPWRYPPCQQIWTPPCHRQKPETAGKCRQNMQTWVLSTCLSWFSLCPLDPASAWYKVGVIGLRRWIHSDWI